MSCCLTAGVKAIGGILLAFEEHKFECSLNRIRFHVEWHCVLSGWFVKSIGGMLLAFEELRFECSLNINRFHAN